MIRHTMATLLFLSILSLTAGCGSGASENGSSSSNISMEEAQDIALSKYNGSGRFGDGWVVNSTDTGDGYNIILGGYLEDSGDPVYVTYDINKSGQVTNVDVEVN